MLLRRLSRDWQITAQSVPEIHNLLKHKLIPDLIARGVDFDDRRLYSGPWSNAMILFFNDLGPEVVEKLSRRYIRQMEQILDREGPVDIPRRPPREVAAMLHELAAVLDSHGDASPPIARGKPTGSSSVPPGVVEAESTGPVIFEDTNRPDVPVKRPRRPKRRA